MKPEHKIYARFFKKKKDPYEDFLCCHCGDGYLYDVNTEYYQCLACLNQVSKRGGEIVEVEAGQDAG